jgi:hypothetical protein
VSTNEALEAVLAQYQAAFRDKEFADVESDSDVLMEVFGITPTLKESNRQYWGRELGMCWQRLCATLCAEKTGDRYQPPVRVGADEPYDFRVDDLAIDTKYRVGSGDAGTLKKFKANGRALAEAGLTPTLVILRDDNLAAAMTACRAGGWDIRTGDNAFELLKGLTEVDLREWLASRRGMFVIAPPDLSTDE